MVVSLLCIFLLGVVFANFVSWLGFVGFAFIVALAGADPTPLAVVLDPLVVTALVGVVLTGQYLFGPRLALRMEGAEPASEAEYPQLHETTRRMAMQYDVEEPDVAVIDSRAPNAFVVGRPGSATLSVTEGLLSVSDGDQLEAVVAHELAHVRNRDTSLMTVAFLLPTLTYYTAKGTFYVMLGFLKGASDSSDSRSTRRSDSGTDNDDVTAVLIILLMFLFTILVAAILWVASFLLFRVLSRQRELAADEAAVEATGDPAALASALRTLETETRTAPDEDLRMIDGGAESLFIVPIESSDLTGNEPTLLNADLFPRTHPPTEDRVERIERMAATHETERPPIT